MKRIKTLFIMMLAVTFIFPMCVNAEELNVMVTTPKGLIVRENSTMLSARKGGLVYGSVVRVETSRVNGFGCSNGWYKIISGTYNGKYICSNYTKASGSSVVSNGSTVEVNNTPTTDNNVVVDNGEFSEKVISVTTGLNLRSDATTKSTKLARLNAGKNYVATERVIREGSGCKNNTWYRIQVNDKNGWVCSAYTRDGASTDKFFTGNQGYISWERANNLGVSTSETFVEINLTEQKLYFFKDGVLELSSSIVTGDGSRGSEYIDTKVGNFTITEKTRNKYFKDSNVYSNYWMRFNGGIGLHDADNWRSNYGYKASHGCVNLPLTVAKTIYDNVSIGTRVIVHN